MLIYRRKMSVLSFIISIFFVFSGFSSLWAQDSMFKQDDTKYTEDTTKYSEDETKYTPSGPVDVTAPEPMKTVERAPSKSKEIDYNKNAKDYNKGASQYSGGSQGGGFSKSATMEEWRQNTIQLGISTGFHSGGGGIFLAEMEYKPLNTRRLWWRFGLGLSGGSGSGEVDSTFGSGTFNDGEYSGFHLYFAPEWKLYLGKIDFNIFAGLGLQTATTNVVTYGNNGYIIDDEDYSNVCLGPIVGVEADFKVGPGCIYALLSSGYYGNLSYLNLDGVKSYTNEALSGVSAFNVGVGYKIGFRKR